MIAAMLAGCGKDDPVGPHTPPAFTYPGLDTPEHTLLNLKYAWERRDSVRTREIYDDNYIGVSTDHSDNTTLTFTKEQEVAVVWALGRDPQVVTVMMDLKPEYTWQRLHYASDPPEVETIDLMKGVSLEVVAGDFDYYANSSTIQFKFRREIAGSDTTWRIFRWTEDHQP